MIVISSHGSGVDLGIAGFLLKVSHVGDGVTLKASLLIHLMLGTGSYLELQLRLLTKKARHGLTLWLGLPHRMVAGFPGQVSQEGQPGGSCLTFDDLVLEVTQYHLVFSDH